MSILLEDLQKLLPLSHSKNSARRHVQIFKAVDILYDICTWEKRLTLSGEERELARGFIAALVYEFITDRHVFWYTHHQSQTSLVECGECIDIHDVKVHLTREHRGFGPSLRKVGESEALKPLLDEVLLAALEKPPDKFLELKNVDRLSYKSHPQKTPKRGIWGCITAKIFYFGKGVVNKMEENLLSGTGRANFYRLFLYIQPSFNVWMKAYEQQKISVKAPFAACRKVFSDAACGLEIDGKNRDALKEAISSFNMDEYYKFRGKLAQKDNQIVDDLLMELPHASPPEGLRITNALSTTIRITHHVASDNNLTLNHGCRE